VRLAELEGVEEAKRAATVAQRLVDEEAVVRRKEEVKTNHEPRATSTKTHRAWRQQLFVIN
jgi:hypothetical protein